LGATTPRYPSCIDGCTGCGSLTADPANPGGTGKKGGKGGSVPLPLDCSVVALTVADDGSDDNTCAAVAATCNAAGGKSGKVGGGDSGGKKTTKSKRSTGNPTEGASSANPAIIGAAIAATVVLAIGVAAVRSRISWLPNAAGAAPEISESVAEPSAMTESPFYPRANAIITNPMYQAPGTDGV
jgi:hypothetical protein